MLLLWLRVAICMSSSEMIKFTCSQTEISSGYISSSFSGWYKSLNEAGRLMTGELVLNLSKSGDTIMN